MLTRLHALLAILVATAGILLIWQAAAWTLPDFLMPGVATTVAHLTHSVTTSAFRDSLLGSLLRLGSGYTFALACGISISLAASLTRFSKDALKSAIVILQSIPSIAWVPLFLIVMGFGDAPIIVVVAISAFYPVSLSVMNATEHVQRVHVQAARVMGASPLQLLRRVYLPAVIPELITGAQLAFGNAWRALIAAEMIVGFGAGLGRNLAYAGEIGNMVGVMENILLVAILATVIDRVLLEGIKRIALRHEYPRKTPRAARVSSS